MCNYPAKGLMEVSYEAFVAWTDTVKERNILFGGCEFLKTRLWCCEFCCEASVWLLLGRVVGELFMADLSTKIQRGVAILGIF